MLLIQPPYPFMHELFEPWKRKREAQETLRYNGGKNMGIIYDDWNGWYIGETGGAKEHGNTDSRLTGTGIFDAREDKLTIALYSKALRY